MNTKRPSYPWAQLYNLESRLGTRSTQPRKRPGRPPAPFPRRQISVHLSNDEIRALTRAHTGIRGRLETDNVNRSQVIGLALRLLQHRLEAADLAGEAVLDWNDLVAALFSDESF